MEISSEQKPRHKWSDRHRHLLCLLSKLYKNSIDDMTKVINHILAEELRAEGFQSGMPSSTIRWQLLNMQQGASGYDIWRKIILDPTISQARKTFREGRDAIEDAALALGIGLYLRTQEVDSFRHGKRLGKRAKKIKELRGVLGDIISSDDDSESGLQSPRDRRRKSPSIQTHPMTLSRQGHDQFLTPISLRSGDNTPGLLSETSSGKGIATKATNKPRILPRLVFRWYNNRSQGLNTPTEIVAGKFLDKPKDIPPPEWALEAVRNHLTPHKLPSPFVSFRESLRPCLFRALKAGVETHAHIAIVDLWKLRDMNHQKWGSCQAIKACPDLVEQYNLTLGGRGTYKGGGEWLTYGKIEKEAIISTVKISDFSYYENRIPLLAQILQLDLVRAAADARILSFKIQKSPADMSWDSGVAVGSLMNYLEIPDEYWNDVGDNIVESWMFRGWRRRQFDKGYEAYINGIIHAKDNPHSLLDVEDAAEVGNKDVEKISSTPSTIMADQINQLHVMSGEQEQELIDAQLYAELASFLWDVGSPHEDIPI